MKKLRIGIIDIVSRGPTRALYARIMNASLASIMPQVIGVWCKEEGHDVTFVCYTGFEDLLTELPDNVDLVFISAFTEAAQTAYALSHLFRSRGAVTALGIHVSARQQPVVLPGVRERWPFLEQVLAKAPLIKIVPLIGSLGCPYTCSFCIDSTVPYQPLDFEILKDDLRFLTT